MASQEKENRAENREETRKEKSDKPARLGKEAKIGAAVILLLVIVFAVVVVVRLRGTDADTDQPSTAAKDSPEDKKTSPGSQEDRLFAGANSKSHSSRPSLVVPVKDGPGKPPMPGGSNRWASSGDKDTMKSTGSRYGSFNSGAVLASDPPKPHRQYGDLTTDSARYKKTEPSTDPFGAKKLPSPQGTSTISRNDFDRMGSSDQASTAVAPAPLPGDRGGSRYGDHRSADRGSARYGDDRSGELSAPIPRRDTPSYGDLSRNRTPAKSVSQYDDDDEPRDIERAAYDRKDHSGRLDRREPDRLSGSSFGKRTAKAENGKYVIQPGDSYSSISQSLYGTTAYFKALAEYNRGKFANENRLEPGETIGTPTRTELEKLYPDLCRNASRFESLQNRMTTASTSSSYNRGRTYVVAEGDTLFDIARYELGKASRWAEIYDLNRDKLGKDFNYLTPGMKLILPDGEKSDVLTKRQGDTYR